MRADLRRAMKAGDRTTVAALRSVLAAFDNAEAVDSGPNDAGGAADQHVAGATPGLGSTEGPRRSLSTEELASILMAERDQHREAARQAAAAARGELAVRHARQAEVLGSYLDP
jgi:uncharacterized protein YqeY